MDNWRVKNGRVNKLKHPDLPILAVIRRIQPPPPPMILVWNSTDSRGQKSHSSDGNYKRNLESMSNSSQSTRPIRTSALVRFTGGNHITYYSLMFFIAYTFKGQVHVLAGRVKIVSHSSCRTSAILKYFCPLDSIISLYTNNFGTLVCKTKTS